MMAHTHNSPKADTYSIFSWEDLQNLAKLAKNGEIDNSNFASFLATADNTNYAFTITDMSKFNKFYQNIDRVDYDGLQDFKNLRAYQKYYNNKNGTELIKANSNNPYGDKKLF